MNSLALPKRDNNISKPIKYTQAIEIKKQALWEELKKYTLRDAIQHWLDTISNPNTKKSYSYSMSWLAKMKLIDLDMTLEKFALLNLEKIIDEIKLVPGFSEATKQARAACFISFTGYLSRKTEGIIKKAVPCKEGLSKTFSKIRDKVATDAHSQNDVVSKINSIKNLRDKLIAKLIYGGAKRKNEVINAKIEDINWEKREISFSQSKTKGSDEKTIITYSQAIMDELKMYLGIRVSGFIFITRNGHPLTHSQLNRSMKIIGLKPHELRASAVTILVTLGYADRDIAKVSGHKTMSMVRAYDKSDMANNPTKLISLI